MKTRKTLGTMKTNCRCGSFSNTPFSQMLCHKYCSFLTARWTQIKSLAAEWPEIIMSAARIRTADSGHAIQVIAAGKKMFINIHYTVKMEPFVFVSVLFFVDIAEISKMLLEYGMQDISTSGSEFFGFG